MRKLIRKILREQFEDYIFPKYKNPDEQVFAYLDKKLNGLEKTSPINKYQEGFVFTYPDEEHGILGWRDDGNLFIYYDLIDEISSKFHLIIPDSKSVIGRWFSDRYKLEVIGTHRW
jgi:hypothetical protein